MLTTTQESGGAIAHTIDDAPGFGDICLAAVCLAVAPIVLHTVPLRRILRLVRDRQRALTHDGRDHTAAVSRLLRALGFVGAFYTGRAYCLERSLALIVLLTIKHIPDISLQIGVTPYGFAAHAWVTYRGQPVNERPDRVKEFVPFPIS